MFAKYVNVFSFQWRSMWKVSSWVFLDCMRQIYPNFSQWCYIGWFLAVCNLKFIIRLQYHISIIGHCSNDLGNDLAPNLNRDDTVCRRIYETPYRHYNDVIMSAMTSQTTSLTIVYSTLFRRRSKKTSKLRVTALCEGNSPLTGEFPTQRAGNAEMFPFDDVIIEGSRGGVTISSPPFRCIFPFFTVVKIYYAIASLGRK